MKAGFSFKSIVNIVLVFVLIGFGVAFVYTNSGKGASHRTSTEWVAAYSSWQANAVPFEFSEANFTPGGKYGTAFGEAVEFFQNRFGENWEVKSVTNWRGVIVILAHGRVKETGEVEIWTLVIAYDELQDKMELVDKWKFEPEPSG